MSVGMFSGAVISALLAASVLLPGALRADGEVHVSGGGPLLLNLRVIEGDGAVHQAGERSKSPLTVQVTDATGRPVPAVAVTFLMPSNGPAGIFASGLSTEVLTTGKDGRASVRGIRWGRETGTARIRITAMKGQTRAGTLATQHIQTVDRASEESAQKLASVSKPRGKWLAIAVIAAGAAAGGLVLGLSGGGAVPAAPAPGSGAVVEGPPVQVGAPTITIGKP